MRLAIDSEDFCQLSSASRNELLALLMGAGKESGGRRERNDLVMAFCTGSQEVGLERTEGGQPTEGKRVIGINAAQGAELLSNLAEKSQQTLRLFADGERVAVGDLVGEERPYKDMNDLKRSLVGAVNRRLRTVVGNRSAVLFSSDRDRQRIRVLPSTAWALRQAMGIPEPETDVAFDGVDGDDDLDSAVDCPAGSRDTAKEDFSDDDDACMDGDSSRDQKAWARIEAVNDEINAERYPSNQQGPNGMDAWQSHADPFCVVPQHRITG